MKYCPFCGAGLLEDAVFCTSCGKKQQIDAAPESLEKNDARPQVCDFAPPKKTSPKRLRIITVCAVCLIAAGALIFAAVRLFTPFERNTRAIEAASKSVVKLSCYDINGYPYGSGSGFAVFDDGVILTNFHVISGDTYSVTAQTEDGLSFELTEVLAYDEEKDIAILSTSANSEIELLDIGDETALKKGETIVAIGSPLGLINSVSSGTYSGYVNEDGMDMLQFSAAISSGSSGGALFNNRGQVIGITSASYVYGQNINLAIPISMAAELYENRTAQPLTIPEFYELWDHVYTYSLDYILANYDEFMEMEGTTMRVEGYVSGTNNADNSFVLVDSSEDADEFRLSGLRGLAQSFASLNISTASRDRKIIKVHKCPLLEEIREGDCVSIEGLLLVYTYTSDNIDVIGLDFCSFVEPQ